MFVQCKFVQLAKVTVTRENLTLQQFSNLILTDWFSDKKDPPVTLFLRCLPTRFKERSLQEEEKKKAVLVCRRRRGDSSTSGDCTVVF